jgi:shikimate dehydrogenase
MISGQSSADDSKALYGLIGSPVGHSLSPFIMNRAFRRHGMQAVYTAFDVKPERLAKVIDGLSTLGAGGVNVTYPLKEAVLEYVDVLSPEARLVQAANTLVFREGEIHGYNTDAPGAVCALELFAGLSLEGKRVFVFGAGGAARAVACGVLRQKARSVTFGARTIIRARGLVERCRLEFAGPAIECVSLQDPGAAGARRHAFERADIVVNATPIGMGTVEECSLIEDAGWIHPRQCFFDLVYHPRKTAFLETARSKGAQTLEGITMLVSQAAESFRLWTGRSFDVKEMLAAVESTAGDDSGNRGGSTER